MLSKMTTSIFGSIVKAEELPLRKGQRTRILKMSMPIFCADEGIKL
jgi:hypothetical protein